MMLDPAEWLVKQSSTGGLGRKAHGLGVAPRSANQKRYVEEKWPGLRVLTSGFSGAAGNRNRPKYCCDLLKRRI